ncbi:M23 family metallopeptidase [Lacimicrobium alkaliphilum]|uniref:M23ase beta-sheet core domain-containing protein n=1 Tax=Lacimicrobium alkaliphilum TaxID=1526571 RepID=A0ABQ1R914_9ALTE|nr:M23 family metallopeptidase [Lacimicrobium alkaliphilum]GGD59828.1 hypothetical protein GCM10011357_13870 [Lacimicrobium alkaliphilum]
MISLSQRHIVALVLVTAAMLMVIISSNNASESDVAVLSPSPVPIDNSLLGDSLRVYGPQQPDTYKAVAETQQQPRGQIATLQPGQNLTRLLGKQGISAHRVALLAMAAESWLDLGKLKTGVNIEVSHPTSDGHRVRLAREYGEVVEATYANNAWSVRIVQVPTWQQTQEQGLTISNSLYQDAAQNNIPVDVINSAILALSHFVDFQRQVQKDDVLEVRFERTRVHQDQALFAHLPNPLSLKYLRFTNAGEDYRLIRFNDAFYFPDSRLAQSFLLKTPLNGARLSSHFGNRHHPVLGYDRLHKGIDFSAPVGTPILAAGRGVVKRASRYGSFGKAVVIDHGDGYETLYAHLKGFAGNLSQGDSVKQGDIIGYLGNTGLSAGRHLHYEVHRHGRALNPLKLKAPAGISLQGEALARFQHQLAQLTNTNSQLTSLAP